MYRNNKREDLNLYVYTHTLITILGSITASNPNFDTNDLG